MKLRPRVAVVGAGRAGSALAVALQRAGYAITAVASRNPASASFLAARCGARPVGSPLAAVRAADITLLTVPDGALPGVAATIASSGAALRGRGVVHTAARLSAEAIGALRITGAQAGALHPLQALAGPESAELLIGSFFRVDAAPPLRGRLLEMVAALGGHEIEISRDQLDRYHAAAVLAGNAPLALLARATEVLTAAGVDRESAHAALASLLQGAAHNARQQGPTQALTGPVVRGDVSAIAAHLRALQGNPEVMALYARMVTEMERLTQDRPPVTLVDEVA